MSRRVAGCVCFVLGAEVLGYQFYFRRTGEAIAARTGASLARARRRSSTQGRMGSSDGAKGEKQSPDGDSVAVLFKKLARKDSSWDRDQLGDVLHWLRQALALVCGIVWGLIPLTGFAWIIVFVALSSATIYGVYSLYLRLDGEDFGGDGALLQEGFFASMTLFLLAWILVYSLVHF